MLLLHAIRYLASSHQDCYVILTISINISFDIEKFSYVIKFLFQISMEFMIFVILCPLMCIIKNVKVL